MKDASIGIVMSKKAQDQILWVKRKDLPIWVLPGGGIEPGESPEEAVRREIREECGLEVTILRKAAHYTPINCWTRHTHIFICVTDQAPVLQSDEAAEMGFFKAPPQPYFPLHQDWIDEAFQNGHALIERPMDDFSYKRVATFLLRHPIIFLRYLFLRLFGCF